MTEETSTTLAPISASVLQVQNAKGPSNCLRCKIPLERSWDKPLCGVCKRELTTMHEVQEYTMYRKAYYAPSTEGVSLEWLLTNGYEKEITLPYRRPKSIQNKHPVGVAHEAAMNTS